MPRASLNGIEEPRDVRHLVERSARLFSDKTAFAERDREGNIVSLTYDMFLHDVRALAAAFIERRYAGRRVSLVGENSYVWVLAYFALAYVGAVVVPLDKELSSRQMSEQMARASVVAVCHTPSYATEAAEAVGYMQTAGCPSAICHDLGSLVAGTAGGVLLREGAALLAAGGLGLSSAIEIDPEAACAVLFTSGTTGTSKGVMLTNHSLMADVRGACELVLFTPEDTLLSVLPVHHAYEAMAGILCPVYFGCTIAFCPGPKSLPRCLETFAPTILCLVPLYVETFRGRIERAACESGRARQLCLARGINRFLHAVGLSWGDRLVAQPRAAFGGRLRLIIAGGASLGAGYPAYFRSLGVTLIEGYGITECSPIVAVNRNHEYRDGSIGRAVSCADIRFDAEGQMQVRGPLVMKGYLDDEAATASCLQDGWFSTGDLGYQDADGYLYVTGRSKDLIVLSNGKNVMPSEVETVLMEHPAIADVVVLAGTDGGNGPEHLIAHIHPDYDALGVLPGVDVEDAVRADIRHANRGLPYHKRIARFRVAVEPFEKTTTCKTRRFLLMGNKEETVDV